MKILMPVIAACVFMVGVGVPHSLHADETSPPSEPPGHHKMQDDANASAQADTDMSYGGTSDTHSESGSTTSPRCRPRAKCDIYFGGH